ncbi:hypothetical protein R83H12_01249 [Fibrobacteria bacterium R8-3-H12]
MDKGRNAEMASRSVALDGYETFIAEIKANLSNSMDLAEAIKAAIKTCLSRNILVYFLREHGSEVLNMIFTEWNWDDAIAVAKEEGIDIGVEKRDAQILDLIGKGCNLADIENFIRRQKA